MNPIKHKADILLQSSFLGYDVISDVWQFYKLVESNIPDSGVDSE